MQSLSRIGFMLALMFPTLAARAAAPDAACTAGPFVAGNAIAAERLDGYRGGFTTETGLAVTLGLERIVTINGQLAEQSTINFGDLGSLASGRSTLTSDAAGQLRLIQNGVGSNFAVDMGKNALGGTVIQNTLNNQLINSQTVINANVNARGMLQAMNFQSSLANALYSAAHR